MPGGDDFVVELDLGASLGAEPAESFEVLTLYLPDRDRTGNELGTQRKWVLEAAQLLSGIGGGATIEPAAEGVWFDAERDNFLWERTVRVFTFINPDAFLARLPELREFLHRFGRETRQGEVAIELAGRFWRIRTFEP
jgi:hypothetical protein